MIFCQLEYLDCSTVSREVPNHIGFLITLSRSRSNHLEIFQRHLNPNHFDHRTQQAGLGRKYRRNLIVKEAPCFDIFDRDDVRKVEHFHTSESSLPPTLTMSDANTFNWQPGAFR